MSLYLALILVFLGLALFFVLEDLWLARQNGRNNPQSSHLPSAKLGRSFGDGYYHLVMVPPGINDPGLLRRVWARIWAWL